MGQIKHYNNGKWTIYTSGEDLSGYTGTTDTYYIGVNNTDGDYSKVNPDGELINLEKEFQYEIGQYVEDEGGVIFHRFIEGNVQKYLVVDIQDLGNYIWSNIDSDSCNAISLWRGELNTEFMVEQLGANSGAAFECIASTNGGVSNWYLPSIQELNKLWNNMFEVSKGIEIAGGNQLNLIFYWSSTETSSTNARTYNFFTGISSSGNKNEDNKVRAVRKFSI